MLSRKRALECVRTKRSFTREPLANERKLEIDFYCFFVQRWWCSRNFFHMKIFSLSLFGEKKIKIVAKYFLSLIIAHVKFTDVCDQWTLTNWHDDLGLCIYGILRSSCSARDNSIIFVESARLMINYCFGKPPLN